MRAPQQARDNGAAGERGSRGNTTMRLCGRAACSTAADCTATNSKPACATAAANGSPPITVTRCPRAQRLADGQQRVQIAEAADGTKRRPCSGRTDSRLPAKDFLKSIRNQSVVGRKTILVGRFVIERAHRHDEHYGIRRADVLHGVKHVRRNDQDAGMLRPEKIR